MPACRHSPGTLAIAGNFEQLSDGLLDIELASLTDFDVLMVSGSTSLAGALAVHRFGNYAPAIGDEFIILRSTGALSGSFAEGSPSLSGFADGVRFGVVYDSALRTVTLQVVAVPETGTWAMMLAGLGGLVWVVWRRRVRGASAAA